LSQARPVVAVTGLEGRDNPYPGVSIARALRAARGDAVGIVGLSYEPTLTGNYRADLFDRVYTTPLPGDPAATLLRRILEIHAECPIDVLIPALDSELALFTSHRDLLGEHGIRLVVPSPQAVKARYKQRLFEWARSHSIPSPRTEVVTKPETFWEQESWSFPCFLKGPLADAVRVRSLPEAVAVYHRLVGRWGYPVLAQEPVVGTEVDVCAVVDPSGTTAGSICIQKTVLSRAGKGIGAEVLDCPEALAAAEEVIAALCWEGPLEVEMIREASSGRFFLLEVNARFPAWIGMCPQAGLNLPDLLLRIALGEPLPEDRQARPGTRFLRGSRTTITDVGRLGELLSTGRLIHTTSG
jgi:carbamoyl-phosphate synthase large subunit